MIIPVYNRAETLRETVASVFAQNYRPLELIIVDDGSTDPATSETIFSLAQEADEHMVLVKTCNKYNGGASSARNCGIETATGSFVQFLDSDDILHPDRLSRLALTFQNSEIDFIVTGFQGFDGETGEIIETHCPPVDQSAHSRALAGTFWGNSLRCAYRMDLVRRIGPWDEALNCFEDREYTERALFLSKKVVNIPAVLASARRTGDDRLSNKLRTFDGRGSRIECEKRLLNLAIARGISSPDDLSTFASRLYGLGVRSYSQLWVGHGRACGEIALLATSCLDKKGQQRRLAWKMGIIGGMVYGAMGQVRRFGQNHTTKWRN